MTREAVITYYENLISAYPELKRKGKANPYTSMNGNMFTFISKEGHICLRFDKKQQEKLMETYEFDQVIQYNAVMRGYVEIPDEFLDNKDQVVSLFDQCVEYAKTLKAKPSKKS